MGTQQEFNYGDINGVAVFQRRGGDKCRKCCCSCKSCYGYNKQTENVPLSLSTPQPIFSESAKLFAAHTLVFLLAVGIYSNSLSGEFVHDDVVAIVRNPDVNLQRTRHRTESGESGWWSLWKNDYWGMPMSSPLSHKSYRPLTVLTFRLNYWMCGETLCPEVFHWTNVLIHAVTSSLTVYLCRGVLRMKLSSSILVGCLFAVHPVHTEAVAGITGRADTLAGLMMLVSFILYHRSMLESEKISQNFSMKINYDGKCERRLDGNQNEQLGCSNLACCDTGSEISSCEEDEKKTLSDRVKMYRKCEKWPSSSSKKSYAFLLASGLVGCASMCAKENGITVLGINLLYEFYIYLQKRRKINAKSGDITNSKTLSTLLMKRRIIFNVSLIILSLSIRIALMQGTFPRFGPPDNPAAYAPSKLTRLLTFLYLPVFNFWLILYPCTLSYDWQMGSIPLVETIWDQRIIASVAFYLTLLLLTWTAIQSKISQAKGRTLAVSLLFIVLPFLPASNLLFPVGFVVAERILYTSSLGVCILVALGMEYILNNFKILQIKYCTSFSSITLRRFIGPRNLLFPAFTFILLTSFALRTWQRNLSWQSRLTLFSGGIKDTPENAKMHYNYANIQKDLGNTVKAIEHYSIAVRLWPEYASAHNNLGTLLMGNPAAAEHQFLKAIKAGNQAHGGAHFNLGVLYMNNEKFSEAATHFKKSLIIDPSHPEAFRFLNFCVNKTLSNNFHNTQKHKFQDNKSVKFISRNRNRNSAVFVQLPQNISASEVKYPIQKALLVSSIPTVQNAIQLESPSIPNPYDYTSNYLDWTTKS